MSSLYELGQVIDHKNQRWLVVRIVKSTCLFEPEEGDPYIQDEHYVEVRNARGEADFIVLSSERMGPGKKVSGLKGLMPVFYGRKDFEHVTETDASRGTYNS